MTATENEVQASQLKFRHTHTLISGQDNNMTGGTVIFWIPPKNSRIQVRKTKKSTGEVNSSVPQQTKSPGSNSADMIISMAAAY